MGVVEKLLVGDRDARVAVRRDLDEAGALETLQRLADRRPRNAQPLGEFVVAQMLTGPQSTLEDRFADRRVHLVAEDGADRVDGHERNSGHGRRQVYVGGAIFAEALIYR